MESAATLVTDILAALKDGQRVTWVLIVVVGFFIRRSIVAFEAKLKHIKTGDEILTLVGTKFASTRDVELLEGTAKEVHSGLAARIADMGKAAKDATDAIDKDIDYLRDWKHKHVDPAVRMMGSLQADVANLQHDVVEIKSDIRELEKGKDR